MKDDSIMPSATAVRVALGEDRSYDIHIADGLLSHVGLLALDVSRGERAVIISQSPIIKDWGAPLISSLQSAGFGDTPILTIPVGERYKTLGTIAKLYQSLYALEPAIDRKTLIIALGGGVVGDVAGFVAASYLRGLPYVQVPTTLLAMVDSSVGGKTGVDFREGKNLIGAFHQPRAVYIDTQVLTTLPQREFASGMGEVIKYGVIADPNLLTTVNAAGSDSAGFGPAHLRDIIARCCAIKAGIVSRDEFEENGLRAILNFGHTIGHALESVTQYRRYKHGEAIAIGMVAAARIGETLGMTAPSIRETLVDSLLGQGLPVAMPADITPESVLALIGRDKKSVAGKARFVLARALGDVALINNIEVRHVIEGLRRSYSSER